MNNIVELAEKSGFVHEHMTVGERNDRLKSIEKLTELIVAECKENFAKVWYEQGMDIRGAELNKFLARFDDYTGMKNNV